MSAAFLAALLWAAPASAQEQEVEGRRPRQELRTQREAEKAAAQPSLDADAGPEPTYAEVLKSPDDVELNYRWAKAQIARGEVKGAAATLERLILVDPGLPRVRLLYAVVLFRLDSLDEAERELLALRGLSMPETLRGEIEEYLREIGKRRRNAHFGARIGFGFGYDSNRNASPTSGQRLFGGVPITLTSGLRQEDTAMLFLGSLSATRGWGPERRHAMFADFTYYRAEQTVVDILDLQVYSMSAGLTWRGRLLNITPTAVFDQIRLSEETYLRTRGGRVRFDRPLGRRVEAYVEVGHTFFDYIKTTDIPTATERTGPQTELGAGLSFVLTPSQRLALSVAHEDKQSRRRFNAYKRERVRGVHYWTLSRGMFLLSSAGVDSDDYLEPDTSLSARPRHDDIIQVGPTFGLPLGLLHPALKPVLLTAGYTYLDSKSTLTNYTYKDHKISTMATYRWDY